MPELPRTCLVRVVELALQTGIPIVLTVVSVKLSIFYLQWAAEKRAMVLFPVTLNVTRFPVVESMPPRNLLAAIPAYRFGVAPCLVTMALLLACPTCLASREQTDLLLCILMDVFGAAHLASTKRLSPPCPCGPCGPRDTRDCRDRGDWRCVPCASRCVLYTASHGDASLYRKK